MRLNDNKTHLLNIKGNIKASIDNHKLDQVKNQRDLGLQVSENLNWNENCSFRKPKGMCVFFKLRRNFSQKGEQKSELIAYLSYVVPIVTYCSQAWFPNKSQLKEIVKKLKSYKNCHRMDFERKEELYTATFYLEFVASQPLY